MTIQVTKKGTGTNFDTVTSTTELAQGNVIKVQLKGKGNFIIGTDNVGITTPETTLVAPTAEVKTINVILATVPTGTDLPKEADLTAAAAEDATNDIKFALVNKFFTGTPAFVVGDMANVTITVANGTTVATNKTITIAAKTSSNLKLTGTLVTAEFTPQPAEERK